MNEKARVDRGLGKAILLESGREQLEPCTASLTQAVETATKFDDKWVTIRISGGEAGRDAHIEVFLEGSLEVCLPNVS